MASEVDVEDGVEQPPRLAPGQSAGSGREAGTSRSHLRHMQAVARRRYAPHLRSTAVRVFDLKAMLMIDHISLLRDKTTSCKVDLSKHAGIEEDTYKQHQSHTRVEQAEQFSASLNTALYQKDTSLSGTGVRLLVARVSWDSVPKCVS